MDPELRDFFSWRGVLVIGHGRLDVEGLIWDREWTCFGRFPTYVSPVFFFRLRFFTFFSFSPRFSTHCRAWVLRLRFSGLRGYRSRDLMIPFFSSPPTPILVGKWIREGRGLQVIAIM